MNENNEFHKRKEIMVFKDFETAFTVYGNTLMKIANIRQWTVTLMVGLLVVLFTTAANLIQMLIAASFCLIAFLVLELRERSSLKYNKKQVLYLEEMFQIKDETLYKEKIESYVFRDLKLKDYSRRKKIKHLFRSLKDIELIVWMVFWIIVWAVFSLVKYFCS